jgi:UDP-hydrolysing UDP-N-acetyl-D-glucosamine 2-epimerase
VGTMDEAIRHAITKMAHLHFVTNEPARRRVHQLGEDPRTVFLVGNPALDLALRAKLLERAAVERALGFAFRRHNLLVTLHPATLDEHPSAEPMAALLAALETLGGDVGIVFTLPNADPFGRAIVAMIEGYVATHPGTVAHASLGQLLYWSTIAQVDAVVGNSSSGLLEVPSFGKPTINIGDRQGGRLRAPSVVDCAAERDAILGAIRQAFALDCRAVVNPYGDGNAAPRIVEVLERTPDYGALIKKRFFDLGEAP